MRGYIRKRTKDSYLITVSLGRDPVTGKYKQHFESVKGDKGDAQKKLTEILRQIDTGSFVSPDKITLGDFLKRWMDDYARPRLSPRTIEGYEDVIGKHITPCLGTMPLKDLRPDHLNHHYAQQLRSGRLDGKGGLSAKSVLHQHLIMHTALDAAVKWGLLVRNVSDAADPPSPVAQEPRIMNEREAAEFLRALKDSPYSAIFCLFLMSGIRRSEALAIRWSDVDFGRNTISISRSLHHLKTGEFVYRPTKTRAGKRLVSLPAPAVAILSDHRVKVAAMRREIGTTPLKDDDLAFSRIDGSPLMPDTVTHAWIKLVRRLGLKGVRLHDARHTYASLLLRLGISPKVVQEQLGHAQVQTTLNIYSHVLPGLKEGAAEKLGQLLAVS